MLIFGYFFSSINFIVSPDFSLYLNKIKKKNIINNQIFIYNNDTYKYKIFKITLNISGINSILLDG